jgi:transmembrane sensor
MDDDAAVRWAIRLDAAPLGPEEQDALGFWLGADERRGGALLRAQAALAYLDRGRALAVQADAPATEVDKAGPRFGRRAFLAGGALSGLCAAGLAGLLFWPVQAEHAEEIQTVMGEVRRVPLPDGSFASLNTASKVSVAMDSNRRRVRLDEGEAWFQVAHDRQRPFVVEAGDIRVQAVGTEFSVRMREGGADVLVTEGVVETWVVGRESQRTRIAAGARSFVSDAAPRIEVAQAPEAVDRALAWRVGDIALNGEPLSAAVAEINRYNRRQLVVDDPALGREPLVGYFRTNVPENFARAVASMVGARVTENGQAIHLDR